MNINAIACDDEDYIVCFKDEDLNEDIFPFYSETMSKILEDMLSNGIRPCVGDFISPELASESTYGIGGGCAWRIFHIEFCYDKSKQKKELSMYVFVIPDKTYDDNYVS